MQDFKKIMVHAYKKNGWLYRTWNFPVILEKNDYFICVCTKNAFIMTSEKNSKRIFKSRNRKNSFWFFFKDKWFNIIVTISDSNKLMYYINLASPFIFEEEAIKYIDFDIDIKINYIGEVVLLDEDEFKKHQVEFNYGKKLCSVILKETENLMKDDCLKAIKDFLNINYILNLKKNSKHLFYKRKINGWN